MSSAGFPEMFIKVAPADGCPVDDTGTIAHCVQRVRLDVESDAAQAPW